MSLRSKAAPALPVSARTSAGVPSRAPVQRPIPSAAQALNGAVASSSSTYPPPRARAVERPSLATVAETSDPVEDIPVSAVKSEPPSLGSKLPIDGARAPSGSVSSLASSPEGETRRLSTKTASPIHSPRQSMEGRADASGNSKARPMGRTLSTPEKSGGGPRRATVLFFDPQQLLATMKGGSGGKSKCDKIEENKDDDTQSEEDKRDPISELPMSPRTSDASVAPRRMRSSGAASQPGSRRASTERDREIEFISVAIRIRPMLARNKNEKETLEVDLGDNQITFDSSSSTKQSEAQQAKRTFKYDHVFDSRETVGEEDMATQDTIFRQFGDRVVRSALGGFNACLFAYGQTGTGKTHTVIGHLDSNRREERGLLPRILESLFAEVEERKAEAVQMGKEPGPWQVRVSYLEVFNEQLHDLLVPPKRDAPRDALQVRYHPTFGVVISDLTEAIATTMTEALELLSFGTRMRSIASTSMNSRSSRAHTVFTFRFEQTSKDTGDSKIAQVQLIDLAGREQEKSSSDNRERLRERQFINTSLFHLSTCILNLSRGSKGKNQTNEYAFRNSRLTLLLAHSLSGNSRTHMIGAVSPAASDTDETLSTLRFADAVKKIRTTVSCNSVNKKNVVNELTEEIKRLKSEMKQMQQGTTNELHDQVSQLEAVCAHYAERLEQEQNNSKAMKAEREACLKDLGLSMADDGVSLQVGADQGVPYLVNLSEDPYLAGCLMYFLKGPEEVTLGTAEGNTIRLKGLGIKARHCAIKNDGNQKLFLRTIDAHDGERDKDQPRAFLNGRRVQASGCEMCHSDRLVLGHSCAFRVVIPLNAALSRRDSATLMEKADLDQALAEIEDSGSRTFQHLRKYVEDLENTIGAVTAGDFVREVHRCVPLVDEGNQITREIRQAELTFTLQVLTDLWSQTKNMPELVVTVLSTPRASSPRASVRQDRTGSQGSHNGGETELWQGFGQLKFVWSFEKYKGRLQSMRDIYEEMQRHGLGHVQRRLHAEPYSDPWKEIGAGEVQFLIDGVKNGTGMSADFMMRSAAPSRRTSVSTSRRPSTSPSVGAQEGTPSLMSRKLPETGIFDGSWTDEDKPGEAVTIIRGEDLHWNDGEVAKMTRVGKDSFRVTSNGDVHTAHLQADGRLKWGFGGVWIREQGTPRRTSIRFGRQVSDGSARSPDGTPNLSTRGSPTLHTRSKSPDSDGDDVEGLDGALPSWYNIGRRASQMGSTNFALTQERLMSFQRESPPSRPRRGRKDSSPRSPGEDSFGSSSDTTSSDESPRTGSKRKSSGASSGTDARRPPPVEAEPPPEPALPSATSAPSRPARSPPLAVYATGARSLPAAALQSTSPTAASSTAVSPGTCKYSSTAGAPSFGVAAVVNGSAGAGLLDSKELPQDLADLRKENRRLQMQLQELVMRETEGIRSLSDAVSAATEAERTALDLREQKLRAWAERLERKEETLKEMERIAMQLRRLQKNEFQAKSEAARSVTPVTPRAAHAYGSEIAEGS